MTNPDNQKKSYFRENWSLFLSLFIFILGILFGFMDDFRQHIGIDNWLTLHKVDSRLFFLIGLVVPLFDRLLHLTIKQTESNKSQDNTNVLLVSHIEKTEALSTLIKDLAPIGIFKKITTPSIWEFEEKIWGWNPNWSLENKANDTCIKEGLKRVHLKRIIDTSLQEINYVFLEDYKLLDENGNDKGMQFSVASFLEYLTQIAGTINYRNKVKSKYRIWVIPSRLWMKHGELHQKIKRYRDFIVIKGMKEGKEVALMFMNFHWCCNAIGHQYFLEITDTTEVVTNFSSFMADIQHLLEEFGVRAKQISFDTENKKYVLN